MGLFSKIFSSKKDLNSPAYRLERAKQLHGQVIRYVTERKDDNDDVIGRGGALCLHDRQFIIDASGDRIFMTNVEDLEAYDLMSGDGVIIKGPDLLHDGVVRTVTVHFVYYRK